MSTADHRGGFLGYVFIANYLGISIAYWLSFGLAFVDNGQSAVRWRFLLAFQCFPALLLLAGIRMLPDSPRYLASAHRFEEAREVLEHIRGGSGPDVEQEFNGICLLAEESRPTSPVEFIRVLLGMDKLRPHLGRRAWLSIFLQIMASWTGITAVTAYSPVLLSSAGYPEVKQNGLIGGINTVGIIGTIISATIVDRWGRRVCLLGGAFGLFAVNLIAGALYESARQHPYQVNSITPAAVTMLFLFNIIYASTWGTVAFLLPTEIFPSEMRAQGNGFGILGWAVGVGWCVSPWKMSWELPLTHFRGKQDDPVRSHHRIQSREPILLCVRRAEPGLDTSRISVVSRNKGTIAGVYRDYVQCCLTILLEYGEGLRSGI
jgi:MFS family permease